LPLPGNGEKQHRQKRAAEAAAPSSKNVVYLSPDQWFPLFKENELEDDSLRNVMDGVLGFTIRLTSEAWIRRLTSVPSLLRKNLLWLQVLLFFDLKIIEKLLKHFLSLIFVSTFACLS